MIDPQVAWDKLAGFRTSDELNEYFIGEGVKGLRTNAFACPIAVWMGQQTEKKVSVAMWINVGNEEVEGDEVRFNHTPATYQFMCDFDRRLYPELDGFE